MAMKDAHNSQNTLAQPVGFRVSWTGPDPTAQVRIDPLAAQDFRAAFETALQQLEADELGNETAGSTRFLVPARGAASLDVSAVESWWFRVYRGDVAQAPLRPSLQICTLPNDLSVPMTLSQPSPNPNPAPNRDTVDLPSLRQYLDAGSLRAADHQIFAAKEAEPAWYETLARFGNAATGFQVAGAVLTGAEPADDLAELDRCVLALALDRLARNPSLRLSVNVSRASLLDAAWQDEGLAQLSNVDPSQRARLALEVTETPTLSGRNDLSTVTADFGALGVAVWLDDIGTGASSLNEIMLDGVTGIKVDRSLSQHAFAYGDSFGTLSLLADFAALRGLDCIVEGIESVEERALAEQWGASHVQGFFAGKPVIRDP